MTDHHTSPDDTGPIDHYDVAVVGGGLAGLVATAHLAQAGRSVVLIERNAVAGGRARTDDLDGWLFNQGAHALYRNGIGHTELKRLGIDPAGEAPPLKGGQLAIGSATALLPIDAAGLARTKSLSVAGRLQFAKVLATLGRLDPTDFADVPVADWLGRFRSDVAAVLGALVRLATYSAGFDHLSTEVAITQLGGGAKDGVLYLHGGWSTMCGQIMTAAVEAGATVWLGEPVSTIEADDSGHTITAGSRRLGATSVIMAAGGPDLAARLLGVDREVFGDTGPPPEAAVLDLALEEMPKHRFVLGVDQPTYFSVFSPPALPAPAGKVAAVAMRYIGPDDDGSADEHRRSLEQLAEIAGIGTPVNTRFLRRMTVTNGMPLASAGGLAGRPTVAVPGRAAAFVAGDWVGPRGLLADAAIASGVDAAVAAGRAIDSAIRQIDQPATRLA